MKIREIANQKFGHAVLMGRPNTGKSTLLNAIMQQKVSITSPLPQTTRKSKRVIYQDERGKIVFSDTPGMLGKVEDLMGKRVNLDAPKESGRADVLICLVDISRPKSDEENKVIGVVRKSTAKKILVYNKMDKAVGTKDHLADYNYLEEEFDKVIKVSALKDKYVKSLVNIVFELLPDATGEEEVEDYGMMGMNSTEYVEEIIREKAYLFLRREVPYTIKVKVNKITDKKKIIVVEATIFTTADRYKKMIIGEGGQKIKEIGYNARKELELMSDRKIFLELTVKTDAHWMEEFKNEK